MKRGEKSKNSRHLVISILAVATLSLSTAGLILIALVIWFAELINSLTLSLSITGLALGFAAWAIYKIALSSTLKELREEYDRAMSIVSLIRYGYDCATKRVAHLLELLR